MECRETPWCGAEPVERRVSSEACEVRRSAEETWSTWSKRSTRGPAECRGVPRSAAECRGVPRSTAEYAEYRGVPRSTRSTAEYRGVPRSTAEYRGVPRSTRSTRSTEEVVGDEECVEGEGWPRRGDEDEGDAEPDEAVDVDEDSEGR